MKYGTKRWTQDIEQLKFQLEAMLSQVGQLKSQLEAVLADLQTRTLKQMQTISGRW